MVLTVEGPDAQGRGTAKEHRDQTTDLEWPQLSELDLGVCLAAGTAPRVSETRGGVPAPDQLGPPGQPSS